MTRSELTRVGVYLTALSAAGLLALVDFDGPLVHLPGALLVLLAAFSWRSITVSAQTLASLLLVATAIPLLITMSTGMPLLTSNEVRNYFHQEAWLAEAYALMLLQALVLMASQLGRRPLDLVETVKSTQRKFPRHLLLAPVVLILISSFYSNQTQTILQGGYGDEGFRSAESTFGGWPLVFVFSSAAYLVISKLERRADVFFLTVVVGYWLLHGNRSEVLILAFLVGVSWVRRGRGISSVRQSGRARQLMLLAAVSAGLLALFQFIGLFRSTGTVEEARETATMLTERRSVSISTVGASAYSGVAVVGLVRSGAWELEYGATYVDYVSRTFPSGLSLPWERKEDIAVTLKRDASAIGGTHFIGEAYLNFGLLGPILVSLVLASALHLLHGRLKSTPFGTFALIAFSLYLPRFLWYGNIYLYKFLIAISIVFLAVKMVQVGRSFRRKRG